MKTATFLRKLEAWRGDARLYRLSEAIAFEHLEDGRADETSYVVVSAVERPAFNPFSFLASLTGFDETPGGEETFIFPSDATGECYNMCQLKGSFQGGKDHHKALRDAGYEVTQ